MIALVLIITFILIGLLADAVLSLRKAHRSCEKLIVSCEQIIKAMDKENKK